MKKLTLAFCSAMFLLLACNNDKAESGDPKVAGTNDTRKDEWIPIDSATAMKFWEESATPGAMHAMLAKYDGNWNYEMKWWMHDGDPNPQTYSGTCTNKMIMDGRFQQSEFKGTVWGQPFEGISICGYDNAKKVFVNTWMDNMGTAVIATEGSWDEANKTINFEGTVRCANGQDAETRETFKFVDDNTQLMEMYGPDLQTGKEFKSMEIKFTRAQ